ncbi:OTU protein [Amphichorda felina]
MEPETLEQIQARHRRELKDLQGRITSKKKNATKKTRKGINDECADMERQVRDRQAAEVAALSAPPADGADDSEGAGVLDRLENKVEDKLQRAAEKLHISPLPTDEPATAATATTNGEEPAATGGGGGPGKKRNRQKERLARRAAEQEAAAQRAEEEASTMTDHRARESEYMKKMFATYDLAEKDIEPDGHCLFSAVADQLGQNGVAALKEDARPGELPYKTVRRAAAEYMLEHADDFAPFLEDDLGTYAAAVRDTAEWGGQLELMALARRYQVEIRVVQDGRMERIGEEEGKASGKTLWLAYYRHGYGLGEHYNSLRKAK